MKMSVELLVLKKLPGLCRSGKLFENEGYTPVGLSKPISCSGGIGLKK